jgi:hypothetical protein
MGRRVSSAKGGAGKRNGPSMPSEALKGADGGRDREWAIANENGATCPFALRSIPQKNPVT